MKFFKKHMKESIFLSLFLVIIFTCLITFLIMWFGGNGDKYGTRLAGIKDVPLSNSYLNEISSVVKEEKIVSTTTIDLEGRLVNVIINVKDDTTIDDAKDLSGIVKDNFTKDELAFYDIQIFLVDSGTNKESSYPIIGYKHKTSDVFVWSNT